MDSSLVVRRPLGTTAEIRSRSPAGTVRTALTESQAVTAAAQPAATRNQIAQPPPSTGGTHDTGLDAAAYSAMFQLAQAGQAQTREQAARDARMKLRAYRRTENRDGETPPEGQRHTDDSI